MRAVDQKMALVVMKERVVAGKTGSQKKKPRIWTNLLQSMAPSIFIFLIKGRQASIFQINFVMNYSYDLDEFTGISTLNIISDLFILESSL